MEENPKRKNATNFVRYTGLGFQMLATIGLFPIAGYKIDEYRESDKLIFMAILGLVGVLVSLYQVVRQLTGKE